VTSAPNRQLKNSQFALKPANVREIVCASTTRRDRFLIRTLAETGMRRAEVAALNVDVRDLESHRLTI
jgi:integrase